MSDRLPSLVSTEWLSDHLGTDDLVVFDASMHLPAAQRHARAEFAAAAIPGAKYLDLPSVHASAKRTLKDAKTVPILDLADKADCLVVYDQSAIRTAARAWFLLRAQGFEHVAILDGGLDKWRAEGRPLVPGEAMPTHEAEGERTVSNVRTKSDMLANLASATEQVLDVRGADRVFGTGVDPVHGGPNGRIPGSLNLPFGDVFNPDGTYKSPDQLRTAFTAVGVDLDRPVVTTCGSGVTASVLLFALHLIGVDDSALYDGSWAEWSADPDTPKAQGPA